MQYTQCTYTLCSFEKKTRQHAEVTTLRASSFGDLDPAAFSHRRIPLPPGNGIVYCCVLRAACCVRPSYGARPTMHCQWGSTRQFFVFFVPSDLDL